MTERSKDSQRKTGNEHMRCIDAALIYSTAISASSSESLKSLGTSVDLERIHSDRLALVREAGADGCIQGQAECLL